MRKSTTTLTPAQVYRFAIDFCQPHLDFRGKGKVTATVLLTVLFAAAARSPRSTRPAAGSPTPPARRPTPRPSTPTSSASSSSSRKVNAAFRAHLPRALPPHAQAAAPRRRRPDPHPLLWRTCPGQPRDLPRPAEGRHPLVLRLRHRLCRAPRPAVHPGGDPGDPLRAAQGRAPGAAPPGEQGGAPARLAAAGPRLLQRRDHPLPAAGAAAVPDAGGLPRPRRQASQGPQRVEGVQADEEERLVHPHGGRRQEEGPGHGHGIDLREAGAG